MSHLCNVENVCLLVSLLPVKIRKETLNLTLGGKKSVSITKIFLEIFIQKIDQFHANCERGCNYSTFQLSDVRQIGCCQLLRPKHMITERILLCPYIPLVLIQFYIRSPVRRNLSGSLHLAHVQCKLQITYWQLRRSITSIIPLSSVLS